jgi:hypothetical protein
MIGILCKGNWLGSFVALIRIKISREIKTYCNFLKNISKGKRLVCWL